MLFARGAERSAPARLDGYEWGPAQHQGVAMHSLPLELTAIQKIRYRYSELRFVFVGGVEQRLRTKNNGRM